MVEGLVSGQPNLQLLSWLLPLCQPTCLSLTPPTLSDPSHRGHFYHQLAALLHVELTAAVYVMSLHSVSIRGAVEGSLSLILFRVSLLYYIVLQYNI